MLYRIVHRTTYKYKYPVTVGNHVACLKPRSMAHQQPAKSELHIQPRPATRTDRVDFFGNLLCFFTIQEPHRELVVEARSEVRVERDAARSAKALIPWEEAVEIGFLSDPARRVSMLISLDLSRRESAHVRSLPIMRFSRLPLGGQCPRPFWI